MTEVPCQICGLLTDGRNRDALRLSWAGVRVELAGHCCAVCAQAVREAVQAVLRQRQHVEAR